MQEGIVDQRLPRREEDGKVIIGEGVRFERIRRITGYAGGFTARWIKNLEKEYSWLAFALTHAKIVPHDEGVTQRCIHG